MTLSQLPLFGVRSVDLRVGGMGTLDFCLEPPESGLFSDTLVKTGSGASVSLMNISTEWVEEQALNWAKEHRRGWSRRRGAGGQPLPRDVPGVRRRGGVPSALERGRGGVCGGRVLVGDATTQCAQRCASWFFWSIDSLLTFVRRTVIRTAIHYGCEADEPPASTERATMTATTATYIIRADEENNAPTFWDAVHASSDADIRAIGDADEATVSAGTLAKLQALPGWSDGPAHAPNPLIVTEV